ncbi:MAG: hypothetical protein V7459_14020 [Oceanicoccus sp.]
MASSIIRTIGLSLGSMMIDISDSNNQRQQIEVRRDKQLNSFQEIFSVS